VNILVGSVVRDKRAVKESLRTKRTDQQHRGFADNVESDVRLMTGRTLNERYLSQGHIVKSASMGNWYGGMTIGIMLAYW
jgi:hypothetical protein